MHVIFNINFWSIAITGTMQRCAKISHNRLWFQELRLHVFFFPWTCWKYTFCSQCNDSLTDKMLHSLKINWRTLFLFWDFNHLNFLRLKHFMGFTTFISTFYFILFYFIYYYYYYYYYYTKNYYYYYYYYIIDPFPIRRATSVPLGKGI